MKAGCALIAVLALVTSALAGAARAADIDRSYDAVKSMHFSFQQLPLDEAKRVEIALRDQGYDPGVVDGVLGPEARRALERLQHRLGLIPSARADVATLDALGLDAASASP